MVVTQSRGCPQPAPKHQNICRLSHLLGSTPCTPHPVSPAQEGGSPGRTMDPQSAFQRILWLKSGALPARLHASSSSSEGRTQGWRLKGALQEKCSEHPSSETHRSAEVKDTNNPQGLVACVTEPAHQPPNGQIHSSRLGMSPVTYTESQTKHN